MTPQVKIFATRKIRTKPPIMLTMYRTLMMPYRIAHAVRSVFASTSSRHVRKRCGRSAVLMMYVMMNLGLPIGDFSPRAGSSPPVSAACRCSPESREAGRCCCVKRTSATGISGCCATKAIAKLKSCCANRPGKGSVQDGKKSRQAADAVVSAGCQCGPVDTPLILICPQPRILVDVLAFRLPSQSGERIVADAFTPCGSRPRPYVPPPESFVA